MFESWRVEIIQASSEDFWIWTIIFLAVALATGFGFTYYLRRARIIEDTPTSKIRSAVQGYVELIGLGQYFNNNPTLAPLTLTPCLWFSFTIEKKEVRHTSKGTETHWRTVESRTSDEYFKLIDHTGECVIDPKGAEVYPEIKDFWYGHSRWPTRESVLAARKQSFFTSGRYRYTEKRIHDKQSLYALGLFKTYDSNDKNNTMSNMVRQLLANWKKEQQQMLQRFDANDDGEIDLQEWQAVRQEAEKQVLVSQLENSVETVINMLKKPLVKRKPFIISTSPPKILTRKFRIYAWLCAAVFIITAPASVWAISIRLGM